MNDEALMRLAIELAKKGRGWTSPNPMVGAVIVKNETIIGEGWHKKYGELHAERDALANCTQSPKDATMYVTLEPCCHHGKQPPCVDAVIEAGIRRVVVGSKDPNPLVSGKGIQILKEHGIEVTQHVLEAECDKINEVFFHFIKNKTPFVTMKYAMTLDGKIATVTGASQWITGEEARSHVHEQRHLHRAIMVGVGTVLADNPMLNCRMEGGQNPVRVICDTNLRTPLDSQLILTADEIPTILATCCQNKSQWKPYEDKGCRILPTDCSNGHVSLTHLMKLLGELQIDSILLEGGADLHGSALSAGIVQKVQAYIAPKLFGGRTAKNPVGGDGVLLPSEAIYLKNKTITPLGEDILIEGEVSSCLQES